MVLGFYKCKVLFTSVKCTLQVYYFYKIWEIFRCVDEIQTEIPFGHVKWERDLRATMLELHLQEPRVPRDDNNKHLQCTDLSAKACPTTQTQDHRLLFNLFVYKKKSQTPSSVFEKCFNFAFPWESKKGKTFLSQDVCGRKLVIFFTLFQQSASLAF